MWSFALDAFLATVIVVTGISVILFRNPIYSALSLILNFFTLGVIYLLLGSEFLAIIQIIVYAGAIMVLFLFVIMLLNVVREEKRDEIRRLRIFAFVFSMILIAEVVAGFKAGWSFRKENLVRIDALAGSVKNIGRLLFTDYLLPFEITSVLLLVAIIGAVFLGKKQIFYEREKRA